MSIRLLSLVSVFSLIFSAVPAEANGVLRNGYGADSMAMGGTGVAFTSDPLAAMAANPATLTLLDQPMITLSLTGIHGVGDFDNALNNHTGLGRDSGVFPEFALSYPIPDSRLTVGFAVKVDAARLADWRYEDAPGGVDGSTSYGRQTHQSEFMALSATVGLGVEITDKLSLGASVGLVYHRIGLDLPFIFQSEPTLEGWKTLLDLKTDGYGWNANLGLHYQATENLAFGLNYLTKADLHSHGSARGNVNAQLSSLGLDGVEPHFRYDAELDTALPQVISAGLSWQMHERLRLALQVDWIGWSDAYDELVVSLEDGNNEAINELTGGDSLRDRVPVDWKDRFVYRAGVEFALCNETSLQLGYSYGRSPVPSSLTTPLNGSIFEHTITTGIRTARGSWQWALAYQYRLPNAEGVGLSGYNSGEYSNSDLKVSAHLLTVSANYSF